MDPPNTTFAAFYEGEADRNSELRERTRHLTEVYLGKSKDSLDLVDSSLSASDCVAIFGSYAKFCVEEWREEDQSMSAIGSD